MQRGSLVRWVVAMVLGLVGVAFIVLALAMPAGLGLDEDPLGPGMVAWSNLVMGLVALLFAAWAAWRAVSGRR